MSAPALLADKCGRIVQELILNRFGRMLMVHDRITIDPKVMFGKPVIRGTRITVELILRKIAGGMTEQEIVAHHPHLTVEDIRAAADWLRMQSNEKLAEQLDAGALAMFESYRKTDD